jgi:hypothetical protein
MRLRMTPARAMPARRLRRVGAVAAALLIIASCSNDDVATDATDSTTSAETATTVGAEQPDPSDLSQVCFSPIVVQTDWFPQAEHGGIYELLGDDYQVDAERGATTGSLVFRGVDTGARQKPRRSPSSTLSA